MASRLSKVSYPVHSAQFEYLLFDGLDVLRDWTVYGVDNNGYCRSLPRPKPKLNKPTPKVWDFPAEDWWVAK